jgi:uncharacterized membrane protein
MSGESERSPDQAEMPNLRAPLGARLFAVDALRGLLMILMALDHANLLIAQQHSSGEYWGGPLPVYKSALSFLVRLVTHICAPGFFFLMGAGMSLLARARRRQGWSHWAVVRHLFLRGWLLVLLQLLVVNRAWELSPGGWGIQIYIGVLFALGSTMVLSCLLWRLDAVYLLGIAAALLIGTELLVPHASQWGPGMGVVRLIWLVPGGRQLGAEGPWLWVNYPILPWLELVVLGLAFGQWLNKESPRAYKRGLVAGVVFLAVFVAIRYLGGFGNLRPRAGETWIDWLNVVKYPPSIAFTLLTMGVNLIALGLLAQVGRRGQKLLQFLTVFGRAPLFFYVTHAFVYLVLAYLLTPQGTSIPLMLPLWLLGLALLYPACRWYGRLKQRQPSGSILRLL